MISAVPIQMLPKSFRAASLRHGNLPAIDGVAIAGDLGDQQAALVAQACFKPGEAKNTTVLAAYADEH